MLFRILLYSRRFLRAHGVLSGLILPPRLALLILRLTSRLPDIRRHAVPKPCKAAGGSCATGTNSSGTDLGLQQERRRCNVGRNLARAFPVITFETDGERWVASHKLVRLSRRPLRSRCCCSCDCSRRSSRQSRIVMKVRPAETRVRRCGEGADME